MHNDIIKRLARMTLALFIAVALSAGLAHLLGADLVIYIEWMPPMSVIYVWFAVTYSITAALMAGFVFNGDWAFLRRPVATFVVFVFVANYFAPGAVSAFVFPIGLIIALVIMKKQLKQPLAKAVLWLVFLIPFQLIMMLIRTRNSVLLYTDAYFAELAIVTFEVIIISVCLYFIGGDNHALATKYIFCIKAEANDLHSRQGHRQGHSLKAAYLWLKSTPWKTREFWRGIIVYILQLFQVSVVLAVCALGGVLWVGVITMIAFIAYGTIVKKRWHSNSFLACTGMSAALFYGIARALPPFRYSWLLGVVFGLFATFVFYKIECYAEEARENRAYKKKAEAARREKSKITLETATEDEIRQLCAAANVRIRDYGFAIYAFCNGLCIKELWVKHGKTSYEATAQQLSRLRRKIEKQLSS